MTEPSQPTRTRRPRWRLALFGLVLLGSLAIALFLSWHREPEGDRFKRDLREAIPVGATRQQAEEWAEQRGIHHSVNGLDPATLPAEDSEAKFFPQVAGLNQHEVKSFVEFLVPWGSYRVWLTGETAPNQLWVFLPLDETGRVTGHRFFTLGDLAEYERVRIEARRK
jgi:hypothetical protein